MANNPIPKANSAGFGSFLNYLAARVDGLRTARELSRTKTIGRLTLTQEEEDRGKGAAAVGKTESAVNSASAACASSRPASGAPTSGHTCAR